MEIDPLVFLFNLVPRKLCSAMGATRSKILDLPHGLLTNYISLKKEFIEKSDSFWISKNILFSRLYEQFSQNDSAMAPEKDFKL